MSKYMISDGRGCYLRRDANGNYVPVKDKAFGDVYEQKVKASNVLTNCINRNLRDRYKIIEVEIQSISSKPKSAPSPSNQTNVILIQSKDKVAKRIGNEEIEENLIPNLSAEINDILDVITSAEQRMAELQSAMDDVEEEICDIHHYIEFGKFNAYQGYLAFGMLKNRLQKRRKIKDELHILKKLGTCKLNSSMLSDIQSSIDNLSNRKYQPRRLNELFE